MTYVSEAVTSSNITALKIPTLGHDLVKTLKTNQPERRFTAHKVPVNEILTSVKQKTGRATRHEMEYQTADTPTAKC